MIHETTEDLVFLVENGNEYEEGKAREALSARGLTVEEAKELI